MLPCLIVLFETFKRDGYESIIMLLHDVDLYATETSFCYTKIILQDV